MGSGASYGESQGVSKSAQVTNAGRSSEDVAAGLWCVAEDVTDVLGQEDVSGYDTVKAGELSGENPEGDEADEDGDEDGVVDEGGELDGDDEDTEDACVGEDD